MQSTLVRPVVAAAPKAGPRVVETSRGTAHPEHARTRQMVVQSLLLRADRIPGR